MAALPTFELWLEFEQYEPKPEDDPTDGFANVQVRLPDGRRYAMNVWTFGYMQRAPYEDEEEPIEYMLPPDLFVARMDRATIDRGVRQMLVKGEMRSEWLCPEEEDDELGE